MIWKWTNPLEFAELSTLIGKGKIRKSLRMCMHMRACLRREGKRRQRRRLQIIYIILMKWSAHSKCESLKCRHKYQNIPLPSLLTLSSILIWDSFREFQRICSLTPFPPFGFAPFCKSSVTIRRFPLCDALCNGVLKEISRKDEPRNMTQSYKLRSMFDWADDSFNQLSNSLWKFTDWEEKCQNISYQ